MRAIGSFLAVCAFTCTLSAQMSSDQRVQDFQTLVDLCAKRYAPNDWKKQAMGFDQVSPWLDRVRNAKDDLEYYEIAAQYVASLQDTHTSFRTPSSFSADLGLIEQHQPGGAACIELSYRHRRRAGIDRRAERGRSHGAVFAVPALGQPADHTA